MKPIDTVVLIGPHGVGKSTLGHALSDALGWRYDDEIGERLRRAALARDPDSHAQRPQAEFDEAVLRGELQRDAELATRGPRIIETWHPGNLAYAWTRSPLVAAKWEPLVRAAAARLAQRGGLLILPLIADEATLRARCTEPGPAGIVSFFREVSERALALSRAWGLHVAEPRSTARATPQELLADTIRQITC